MANPDPIHLSDGVIYLPGGVNCAIVHGPRGQAVLVDTGHDRDYGRRIRRAVEAEGLSPIAIVNTHAHADHFGGNSYLRRHYQVPIYAPPLEASLMADPYLEPVYLFHGARPLKELTSKWLQAPPSPVHSILEPGPLPLVDDLAIEAIDSSGHAHRQVSLQVGGVLLAADALFGTSVLERYPIPFGQDVAGQLAAIERLEALEVDIVLPGHGAPSRDLPRLAAANRDAIDRVSDVVERSATGIGTEEVLRRTCHELAVTMTDVARYHLNLCTVSAHLSYLRELGRVEVAVESNGLVWRRS